MASGPFQDDCKHTRKNHAITRKHGATAPCAHISQRRATPILCRHGQSKTDMADDADAHRRATHHRWTTQRRMGNGREGGKDRRGGMGEKECDEGEWEAR